MSYNQNNVASVCWCVGASILFISILISTVVELNLSHIENMLLKNMTIEQCIEMCGDYK
jgi:hypothetical protein